MHLAVLVSWGTIATPLNVHIPSCAHAKFGVHHQVWTLPLVIKVSASVFHFHFQIHLKVYRLFPFHALHGEISLYIFTSVFQLIIIVLSHHFCIWLWWHSSDKIAVQVNQMVFVKKTALLLHKKTKQVLLGNLDTDLRKCLILRTRDQLFSISVNCSYEKHLIIFPPQSFSHAGKDNQ